MRGLEPQINLRIKEVMDEKGMTQKQLCALTGIPEESLCRQLKSGRMNLDRLAIIAQALKVDIRDLIGLPVKKEINGFIEYGDEIYSFRTFKRLKEIVSSLEVQIDRPKFLKQEAANIRKIEKDNHSQIIRTTSNLLLSSEIVLDQIEGYDATKLNCWSFRNAGDIRDGVILDLGNMIAGYEFEMLGQHFLNSESAYIAGAYSLEGEKYADIQRQLSSWDNGYTAKGTYRKQNNNILGLFVRIGRNLIFIG